MFIDAAGDDKTASNEFFKPSDEGKKSPKSRRHSQPAPQISNVSKSVLGTASNSSSSKIKPKKNGTSNAQSTKKTAEQGLSIGGSSEKRRKKSLERQRSTKEITPSRTSSSTEHALLSSGSEPAIPNLPAKKLARTKSQTAVQLPFDKSPRINPEKVSPKLSNSLQTITHLLTISEALIKKSPSSHEFLDRILLTLQAKAPEGSDGEIFMQKNNLILVFDLVYGLKSLPIYDGVSKRFSFPLFLEHLLKCLKDLEEFKAEQQSIELFSAATVQQQTILNFFRFFICTDFYANDRQEFKTHEGIEKVILWTLSNPATKEVGFSLRTLYTKSTFEELIADTLKHKEKQKILRMELHAYAAHLWRQLVVTDLLEAGGRNSVTVIHEGIEKLTHFLLHLLFKYWEEEGEQKAEQLYKCYLSVAESCFKIDTKEKDLHTTFCLMGVLIHPSLSRFSNKFATQIKYLTDLFYHNCGGARALINTWDEKSLSYIPYIAVYSVDLSYHDEASDVALQPEDSKDFALKSKLKKVGKILNNLRERISLIDAQEFKTDLLTRLHGVNPMTEAEGIQFEKRAEKLNSLL